MQYYCCKCGKSTAWSSMGVAACTRCKRCGSDLAQGPDGHQDSAPHEYVDRYDQYTGKKYEMCNRCMHIREELEKELEPEPPPPAPPDPYLSLVKPDESGVGYPHCDSYVLHAPGECEYCDMPRYAPLHEFRRTYGINHTGENDPSKKQCPAEARRAKGMIDRWPGNRAKGR